MLLHGSQLKLRVLPGILALAQQLLFRHLKVLQKLQLRPGLQAKQHLPAGTLQGLPLGVPLLHGPPLKKLKLLGALVRVQ